MQYAYDKDTRGGFSSTAIAVTVRKCVSMHNAYNQTTNDAIKQHLMQSNNE